MQQWLVIVARDRPDLWVAWAAFYGGAETVEVLVDRRQGQPGTERQDRSDRRTHPPCDTDLQARGLLVIPRPERVGASR